MQNCTDKFLKHSERVGARFAEHNAGGSSVGPRNLFYVLNAYTSHFHPTEQMSVAQGSTGSDYLK